MNMAWASWRCGDNAQALTYLQNAVIMPTDANIRNDLGVVYLNLLCVDDARF